MEKKSKKSLAVVLLILFIMAGAGAGCLYLSQVHAADENKELVLEEGQEYVYAKITSISGNEMDYIVLDARTMDFHNFPKNGGEGIGNGFGKNAGGGRRNKTAQAEEQAEDGETTEMESISEDREMPEMECILEDGEKLDMSKRPAVGKFPNMSGMTDEDKAAGNQRPNAQKFFARDGADDTQGDDTIAYIETDKTGQIQIPVGTEVETKLGTVTTFSRLSNGDIIKMLLQKDDAGNKELIKIWIVE